MPTPWRIAEQNLTVLHPVEHEPMFTLMFMVNHTSAERVRLRMVPTSPNADALELEFDTGGYPVGTPVSQPRWLAAFERPDPNFYLDDDGAAADHADGLQDQVRAKYLSDREVLLGRRAAWHDRGAPVEAKPKPGKKDKVAADDPIE